MKKTLAMELDFFKNFVVYLEAKGRMKSTIKRYIYDFEDFFQWVKKEKREFNYKVWSRLTEEDYFAYFTYLAEERKFGQGSLKRVCIVLNRLNVYYLEQGKHVVTINQELDSLLSKDKKLTALDFLTDEEIELLLETVPSEKGLSNVQLDRYPKMVPRNMAIIKMFLHEGITLSELVRIRMEDINFIQGYVDVRSDSSVSRRIYIPKERMVEYNAYRISIPEPVRPRDFTDDPFFVAFHFRLGTFTWDYERNMPKNLTEVSVERMLQKEAKRAGLRKGISPQCLRNTCILKDIKAGLGKSELIKKFGFKTSKSLLRYMEYAKANDYSFNMRP